MAFIVLLSVLIDLTFGEPARFHPLVGYGKLVRAVERMCFAVGNGIKQPLFQRALGVVAVLLVIAPLVVIAWIISNKTSLGLWFGVIVLYLAIGAKSLSMHAKDVFDALQAGDLNEARKRVSYIVSRDTSGMNQIDIARAAIESILENGSDAIFGAIFWFLILGAPGAVLYRLANTLDAMWGYKNERYLHFGWAAARFDDLLNYVPARLTAMSYMLVGNWKLGWHCWRQQAKLWYSPNAGPVMASGAGALMLRLGGPASYHGAIKERPWLGEGVAPTAGDIQRALDMVHKTLAAWVIVILIGGLLLHA